MNKFIKTTQNKNINEGIFGFGKNSNESGLDVAQGLGDYASNLAGLASFLPGVGSKAKTALRSVASMGNIASSIGDDVQGDSPEAMARSAMGLGWALGALSGSRAGGAKKIGQLVPKIPTPKALPQELPVRRIPRQQRVIITPPNPITDPNRLLSASSVKPIVVSPSAPLAKIDPLKQSEYSRIDNIDPRILSYVEKANKRKGLPRFKKPSGVFVDTTGGGGTRLSRDLDIPAELKIGGVRSRIREPMTGDRYAEFAATHPGYAEALGRQGEVARQLGLDIMSDRRMKGAFPSVIPIVAGYEPDTVNNILVEAMQEYLKKKII